MNDEISRLVASKERTEESLDVDRYVSQVTAYARYSVRGIEHY